MSAIRLSKRAMSLLQTPLKPLMASPLILIDFDQTITQEDTIAILGQTALDLNQHSKNWSYFTECYLNDYTEHKTQLPELPKHDLKAFVNQLDSYRPVEKASLARVSAHKVFKGLTQDTLKKAGEDKSSHLLQPNVISVLDQHQKSIRIVSLNWSKDWILGILHQSGLRRNQIYSNDLEFKEQIATGEITTEILTTGDKKRFIDTFKQDAAVIYIGDSIGDLLPLVESQVGIVIGQDTSLIKALNEYGFKVQEEVSDNVSGIYKADNWLQINEIITRFKQQL